MRRHLTATAVPTAPRAAPSSVPLVLQTQVAPPMASALPAAPLPMPTLRRRVRSSPHVSQVRPCSPYAPPPRPARLHAFQQVALPQELAPPPVRAAAWLQQGNAFYQNDGDAKRALPYWLQALALGPQPALAASMLEVQGEPQRELTTSALLLLEVSWLQSAAPQARHAYRTAASLAPGVHDITRQLLAATQQDERLHDVHEKLTLRYAALLPEAASKQQQMVVAVLRRDYFLATSLASTLYEAYPHLLAPRCVRFICQFALGGGMSRGGTFVRQSMEQTRQAALVMAFALSRSGDGQLDAIGALSLSEHREVWREFLERAYATEPSVFGAETLENGDAVPLASAARHVAGMPWDEALKLPLAEPWMLPPQAA